MVFRLDLGQISFNLVENAFATRQLALIVTSIAFNDILARACAEIKLFVRESDLRLKAFRFLKFFFAFPFSPFLFIFSAVTDLLLGLLAVKKLLRKRHRDGQFLPMEQPGVVAGNFALSFSLKFFSVFVHISGSIWPITLIWASLERSFPPAEVEYR